MEEDNQTVKQVIKMLVAVVVLFVICWSPTLVINLLKGYHVLEQTNEGNLKELVTGKWEYPSFSTSNPFPQSYSCISACLSQLCAESLRVWVHVEEFPPLLSTSATPSVALDDNVWR